MQTRFWTPPRNLSMMIKPTIHTMQQWRKLIKIDSFRAELLRKEGQKTQKDTQAIYVMLWTCVSSFLRPTIFISFLYLFQSIYFVLLSGNHNISIQRKCNNNHSGQCVNWQVSGSLILICIHISFIRSRCTVISSRTCSWCGHPGHWTAMYVVSCFLI
jgi:hypothetical protein